MQLRCGCDGFDDSCEYAADGYDCDGNCLADADGDGVCDEFEVAGCQDDMACNYDADATDDDGAASMLRTVTTATATACDADGDGVCDEFECGCDAGMQLHAMRRIDGSASMLRRSTATAM